MEPQVTAIVVQIEQEVRDETGRVVSRRMVQAAPVFQSKIPDDVLAWVESHPLLEPQR